MTLEEAYEWLRGERSHINQMISAERDPMFRQDTWQAAEFADAASTQRAYWMVRAHKEGLVNAEG